ncbi:MULTISPECIES: glutamine synthetase family protein [Streptomyces]|jgi:glutamine synthetase|uniref:Glutamine synthetase family protein n=1 Tax=Streptomyces sp. 900129855 TaxID=3155129 RepID=A0ABV3A0H6_9ACTN
MDDQTPKPAGRISLDDLRAAVKQGTISTVMVAVPDMTGRLMGKRLAGHAFLERLDEGPRVSEACSYVLATNVNMDPLTGFALTSWDDGFQDMGFDADPQTLRVLPYLSRTALVHCDAVHRDGAPVEVAPRHLLRTWLGRLADLGYEVRVGLESEFVLCRGMEPVVPHNLDYALGHPPLLADFFSDLEHVLHGTGIPVEAVKTEGAAGQAEVTFPYGPAMEACDNYTVYKHAVRHLAAQQGLTATFMAAPFTGVGSGLHVHLSLWENDAPAFVTTPRQLPTDAMRHSIAGLLSALPHMAPLYAPHVNSYKRYATAHSFAPQYMNWGNDNRGCAVRVTGQADNTHLEIRLPGADANPYLALAASIAAIAHGLTGKLDPPPPCPGDAYTTKHGLPVPRDLSDGLAHFRDSTLANRLFGSDVVRHYARAAEAERDEHRRQVTDIERERGFDRA